MSDAGRRVPLSLEEHTRVAARLAVSVGRPRSEVLAPLELSEQMWDEEAAEWARRLTAEIRERAGSAVPMQERYPLASAYAKAYSDAMREARAARARDERDEDATVRIAPSASRDEPFSLLAASNRAARSR